MAPSDLGKNLLRLESEARREELELMDHERRT